MRLRSAITAGNTPPAGQSPASGPSPPLSSCSSSGIHPPEIRWTALARLQAPPAKGPPGIRSTPGPDTPGSAQGIRKIHTALACQNPDAARNGLPGIRRHNGRKRPQRPRCHSYASARRHGAVRRGTGLQRQPRTRAPPRSRPRGDMTTRHGSFAPRELPPRGPRSRQTGGRPGCRAPSATNGCDPMRR